MGAWKHAIRDLSAEPLSVAHFQAAIDNAADIQRTEERQNMNAKHVPGPWVAYNVAYGRTLKHWRIMGNCVQDDPTFAVINSDGKILPEYEAGTARLIAAAPDLLEACEAAEQLLAAAQEHDPAWRLDTRVDGVRDMARAALAKAKGE